MTQPGSFLQRTMNQKNVDPSITESRSRSGHEVADGMLVDQRQHGQVETMSRLPSSPGRTLDSPLLSVMGGDSALAVRRLLEVLFPDATTVLDATYGDGRFLSGASPVKVTG